jgi:hypothetical protein
MPSPNNEPSPAPPPPLRPERRRVGCLPATDLVTCHFEWGGRFALALQVVDISLRGVALLLPVALRHGERPLLLLARRAGLFSAAVVWRVAHCRRAGENFIVGGPFEVPLSPGAYRQLLG